MKILQTFGGIWLIIAITHIATAFPPTSCCVDQGFLNMPIDNLELEASNIGLLLSEFAALKKVPIGLEVSPRNDLSETKTIRLQIKHGTLTDVLNSIVKQNPLYTWRVQDNVVNVLPVDANRDPLLRDVLETRLEKFSIKHGMSRFAIRQSLT